MRRGVVVVSVEGGTAAARYGFRPGDIVRQVNKTRTETVAQLMALRSSRRQGWRMAVQRGERILRLSVNLSKSRDERFLRRRGFGKGRAAPVGRPVRPTIARRGRGSGPPARSGCAAGPHDRGGPPVVDDPVGPAGHGQDHDRAAAVQCVQAAFRTAVGGVHRRRGSEERPSRQRASGARRGRARCSSSTRSIASTAASRTASFR